MSEQLFGTNGFRGVVGRELTPEVAVKFGRAVATFFGGGRCAVAWDTRLSGPMLYKALVSGLMSSGAEVFEGGLLPTPALQKFIQERSDITYGVMVTASHNPREWNGFKVMEADGVEASPSVEQQIEKIFLSGRYHDAQWSEVKPLRMAPNLAGSYIDSVRRHVDLDLFAEKKPIVVVDPGNGSSCVTSPYLFRRLGLKVVTVNANPDGTFPVRPPEPRPEGLDVLCDTTQAVGADLGVAFDGDGDRVIFCDEKGRAWWGDASGVSIGQYLADKGRCKTVVTPVTSTAATEAVLTELGVEVLRTRVGSQHVSYLMREKEASWGFEENGGGIYAPHQLVRDGGMTTMLMLQIMVEREEPLSKIFGAMPRFWQVKAKTETKPERADHIVSELIRRYDSERLDTTDGVKIWFRDDFWVLVRPSGTEPLMRVFVESSDRKEAEKASERFLREVREIAAS